VDVVQHRIGIHHLETLAGEHANYVGFEHAFSDLQTRCPNALIELHRSQPGFHIHQDIRKSAISGHDVMPRGKELSQALNEAYSQLGAQDFAKAEATARAMLVGAPRFQDAQIILARALLGQNKTDDAEKIFRAALEEPLPFTATLAWANIGLGEIAMKRNQPAEAAKRFTDAVIASRDYPSSLAARLARIRAEAAANNAPPVDETARTFITQLSQAVVTNKKAELESRIVSGELVRFVNASLGTELWDTKVVRTEQINPNLIAADVQINAKKLGTVGTGTAVLMLARTPSGWKLAGIELFEVR